MKKFILVLIAFLLVACDHDDPALTRIDLVVDRHDLSVSAVTHAQAFGYYDDGNVQNLTSLVTTTTDNNNILVGFLDEHVLISLTGQVAGVTNITASYANLSDSETITVSDSPLTSISITPDRIDLATGLTQQYTAVGHYANLTTHDLGASNIAWLSSNTAFATIDENGVATALSSGVTTISASVDSITGSTDLRVLNTQIISIEISAVTPQSVLPIGVTQTFKAQAFYDNDTSSDVTDISFWTTSNSNVLSNDNGARNVFTAENIGTADVSAQVTTAVTSNSIPISVEHRTYQGIVVAPLDGELSIPLGLTKRFTTTAYFGEKSELSYDVSLLSTWVSNSNAASVVLGFVHGNTVTLGTQDPVIITSTFLGKSDDQFVLITPALLQSIDVTPDNIIISKDFFKQYSATGTYTDGSTHSLNVEPSLAWSLVPTAGVENASITIKGLVTNTHEVLSPDSEDFVTARLDGVTGKEIVYLPTKSLLPHNGLDFIGTPTIGEATVTQTAVVSELLGDVLMTFSQAQQHCNNLVYNAYSNWRLPTQNELVAFDDTYNPSGSMALNSVYNWPLISPYWTSTVSDVNKHHAIGLLNVGGITSQDDANEYHVSCVR